MIHFILAMKFATLTNGYVTVLDIRQLTFANSRKLNEKRIRMRCQFVRLGASLIAFTVNDA